MNMRTPPVHFDDESPFEREGAHTEALEPPQLPRDPDELEAARFLASMVADPRAAIMVLDPRKAMAELAGAFRRVRQQASQGAPKE